MAVTIANDVARAINFDRGLTFGVLEQISLNGAPKLKHTAVRLVVLANELAGQGNLFRQSMRCRRGS